MQRTGRSSLEINKYYSEIIINNGYHSYGSCRKAYRPTYDEDSICILFTYGSVMWSNVPFDRPLFVCAKGDKHGTIFFINDESFLGGESIVGQRITTDKLESLAIKNRII